MIFGERMQFSLNSCYLKDLLKRNHHILFITFSPSFYLFTWCCCQAFRETKQCEHFSLTIFWHFLKINKHMMNTFKKNQYKRWVTALMTPNTMCRCHVFLLPFFFVLTPGLKLCNAVSDVKVGMVTWSVSMCPYERRHLWAPCECDCWAVIPWSIWLLIFSPRNGLH